MKFGQIWSISLSKLRLITLTSVLSKKMILSDFKLFCCMLYYGGGKLLLTELILSKFDTCKRFIIAQFLRVQRSNFKQ